MPKPYCYFDISIGGVPLKERVVFELFDDVTPKTCENFRQLCLDNGGRKVEGTDTDMTYLNCPFHRVIPGFMIQGGDYTTHSGYGGVSIYGEKFEDENFELQCSRAGLLAMANSGPNTNGSQFFITTAAAPHLDGKHVVFGRVVRGMNSVRAVEHTETGANDKPKLSCVITACGTLDTLPDVVPAADGDAYPDYPEDNDPPLEGDKLVEAGDALRLLGNEQFKQAAYAEATQKYSKAIRYLAEAKVVDRSQEAVADEKLIACHNNVAICATNLRQWTEAREAASRALALAPENPKALYRRGMAFLGSGDAERALEDLSKAKAADPSNAAITTAIEQAKAKIKSQEAAMAKNLKKMFA